MITDYIFNVRIVSKEDGTEMFYTNTISRINDIQAKMIPGIEWGEAARDSISGYFARDFSNQISDEDRHTISRSLYVDAIFLAREDGAIETMTIDLNSKFKMILGDEIRHLVMILNFEGTFVLEE